jgi:hypothetical protein
MEAQATHRPVFGLLTADVNRRITAVATGGEPAEGIAGAPLRVT